MKDDSKYRRGINDDKVCKSSFNIVQFIYLGQKRGTSMIGININWKFKWSYRSAGV